MNEKHYLIYLHTLGFSQSTLKKLFKKNKNYREVFEHINEYLGGVKNKVEIEKNLATFSKEKIDILIETLDIQVVTLDEENFPEGIRNLPSPPYLIYVRGILDTSPKLAIIGSRKMTDYGKKVIDQFVPTLSAYFTIVSGGALGCDSYAHQITLKNNSKTVAVLGTGIDIVYPVGNEKLFTDISKNGALVSIFPLGQLGSNYTFPMRNEIISALSNGILVIEAGEKSGTLITVNLGLDQGKDIFAVPGDIYRQNSLGCLEILTSGQAKIVTNPGHILEEYNININQKEKETIIFESPLEKAIYDILILEQKTIDQLSETLGKEPQEISIVLSFLELRGMVKKINGGIYEIL